MIKETEINIGPVGTNLLFYSSIFRKKITISTVVFIGLVVF